MYAHKTTLALLSAMFLSACGVEPASDQPANPGVGGQGGSGAGGAAGSPSMSTWTPPAFAPGPVSGQIAGRPFSMVTGLVSVAADDPSVLDIQILGYEPEKVDHIPCWDSPPPDLDKSKQLRVGVRIPKQAGTYQWGSGRSIAGSLAVSLYSMGADGVPHTFATDQAKLVLDGYGEGATELKGSVVIVADNINSVNGAFVVKRCSN